MRVEFEQVLGVEEHAEQHQQHDERRSRNGFNAGFAHDTNGDGAQHEGRENQHGGEDQRRERRETTDGEDDDHGKEGHAHEDGNVLERPFVPTLAFHVFLAAVTLERCTDVREDVGKGAPHLGKTEHAATDDGPDGDGSNGLGEGDHLERCRATAGVVLNGDVGLLGGVVNWDVHEHGQRHEEEPTHDGSQVHEESDTGFHEPTDGEHRRRQRHADVGVGERVPSGLLRPVCLLERDAVHGA